MRRYDDPVEVRRGLVGIGTGDTVTALEGPEQFLWHGRLWKVSEVLAHWVETGPWWRSGRAHAVLGSDEPDDLDGPDSPGSPDSPDSPGDNHHPRVPTDLTAEREVWRVEAGRGMGVGRTLDGDVNRGVFDLVLDWTDGSWRLSRCLD
jgi:hypothetical protein